MTQENPSPRSPKSSTLRDFLNQPLGDLAPESRGPDAGRDLTLEERELIVKQAILLFEEHYAHLPLKRSMHAVDPLQRLKLLRLRLTELVGLDFHREMHSIFTSVRDLHTRYFLPDPYRRYQAYLPFDVGEFFEEDDESATEGDASHEPRYLVVRVTEDHAQALEAEGFAPGAEVLSWNGVPIARAIELLAERYSGSNTEARRARGLARLTIRPLALALPPEESWVRVEYETPGGEKQEVEFDWQVAELHSPLHLHLVEILRTAMRGAVPAAGGDVEGRLLRILEDHAGALAGVDPGAGIGFEDLDRDLEGILRRILEEATPAPETEVEGTLREVTDPYGRALAVADADELVTGMDAESELTRRQRSHLYELPQFPEGAYAGGELTLNPVGDPENPRRWVDGVPILKAFTVTCGGRAYGLIQIHSFDVPSTDAFVDEVKDILEHPAMGRHGLVIDLRGNAGGKIPAGERLLQMLTPRRIEPARLQFVNTAGNLKLCRRLRERARLFAGRRDRKAAGGRGDGELGSEARFEAWMASIDESVSTGEIYSRGFPLTSEDRCNERGQLYHGPTLLITDATCYSTTDIFVAGFRDHGIGLILGVYDNTGAGGANNVLYSDLARLMDGDPDYPPLPLGAEMNVALRRSLRVRGNAGKPLEDLGVKPDSRYRLTRQDLLDGDQGLYRRALDLLDGVEKEKGLEPKDVYYLKGWQEPETKKLFLCVATPPGVDPERVELDYFLEGSSSRASEEILRDRRKRTDAEVRPFLPRRDVPPIRGLEAKTHEFDLSGVFRGEMPLERKTRLEVKVDGEVVAMRKSLLREIPTRRPLEIPRDSP